VEKKAGASTFLQLFFLIKSQKHCFFIIIPQISFTPCDLIYIVFRGEYHHWKLNIKTNTIFV